MDQDSSATPASTGSAVTPGPSVRRHRRIVWSRLALTMVLLLTGFAVARKYIAFRVDDGFIAFEPDASLFPDAPAADAETVSGVGNPIGWPDDRFYCPYDQYTSFSDDPSAFGRDWHTVRHDWTEDGSARAWVISERTTGFGNLREFDQYVQGFRNRTKYCGWTFADHPPGFNSIWTELDGLPDDGFAFTIDVSPRALDDNKFDESNPADFQALGAFLPGRKRGQVMYLLWVAWGTDIPRDQFVEAANTLYDAAHRSPKKDDEDFGDDKEIDYEFTEFDPVSAGVLDIVGDDAVEADYAGGMTSDTCRRRFIDSKIWDSSSAYPHEAEHGVKAAQSSVDFGASRWQHRSEYLEAKQRSMKAVQVRCVDSYQPPGMLIEPITVPGLPEGAFASKWTDGVDAYVAVITDDDKQMLMIVTWREESGPVPEEKFAEVVNRAWDKVRADNP